MAAPQHASQEKARQMRLFFHLCNGQDVIPDTTGIEVESLETAHLEAMNAIVEFLEADASAETDWTGWSLDVADSSGAVLFSFQLGPIQVSARPDTGPQNGTAKAAPPRMKKPRAAGLVV
jgi:hypothetical protein